MLKTVTAHSELEEEKEEDDEKVVLQEETGECKGIVGKTW